MPDELRTAEQEWNTFWNFVKPDKCSDGQVEDMKMSFFAGAYSILGIMLNIPEDVSIDGVANILEGLRKELESFHEKTIANYVRE